MKSIFISNLAKAYHDSDLAFRIQELYELYQRAIGLFPQELYRDEVIRFREKHRIEITMTHNPAEFENILNKELGLPLHKAQFFTQWEEEFYKWSEHP